MGFSLQTNAKFVRLPFFFISLVLCIPYPIFRKLGKKTLTYSSIYIYIYICDTRGGYSTFILVGICGLKGRKWGLVEGIGAKFGGLAELLFLTTMLVSELIYDPNRSF